MARRALVLGAVLIVAGGAALGVGLTRKRAPSVTAEQSAAMASAMGQLDGDLRAARAAVEQRAKSLAENDRVVGLAATDEKTAADLVGRELLVKPEAGEAVELVQLLKDKPAMTLLALPTDAVKRTSATPGAFADLMGDKILVGHTVEVLIRDPGALAAGKRGFMTSSRLLDLAPAIQRLSQAGVTGRIEVGGKSAAIGALPAGAATEVKTLPNEPAATLVVGKPAAAAAMPIGVVAVGGGVAVLGLIVAIIGLLARPGQQTQQIAAAQPPDARPTGNLTKLTNAGVAAAGTPSPVGLAGEPAINPSNLGPGAQIGRWEVVRRLGSGGMADVYLAQAKGEAGFEKLVAIKVMHSHLARNQRAVDHFLDEARLAARIHHPNVVGIQDLGRIGSDYVIVMDYVEGVDLERLLASARAAQRPVPIDVALAILVRICDGLHGAHTATGPDGEPLGIIHRDVKSANVLVSRQGSVKVVDFGIAKAAKQVHYTVQGETKGTPAMMAPEQRVGEQVDVRVDVYSVGAVGYELVTGHGVNLDLAALAHLGVENWPHLPPPTQMRPNLPPELDAILLTAMAFERDRRPADCSALGAQLEDVIKRHALVASDKDIARWTDSELRLLVPAFQGVSSAISRPV